MHNAHGDRLIIHGCLNCFHFLYKTTRTHFFNVWVFTVIISFNTLWRQVYSQSSCLSVSRYCIYGLIYLMIETRRKYCLVVFQSKNREVNESSVLNMFLCSVENKTSEWNGTTFSGHVMADKVVISAIFKLLDLLEESDENIDEDSAFIIFVTAASAMCAHVCAFVE